MAGQLFAQLSTSYGGSEYYTVPQIRVAYRKLRLDPAYIDIAYAQFLDFEEYSKTTGSVRSAYDAGRSLYQRYLPDPDLHSWEPAPVNEYVKQMSGLS